MIIPRAYYIFYTGDNWRTPRRSKMRISRLQLIAKAGSMNERFVAFMIFSALYIFRNAHYSKHIYHWVFSFRIVLFHGKIMKDTISLDETKGCELEYTILSCFYFIYKFAFTHICINNAFTINLLLINLYKKFLLSVCNKEYSLNIINSWLYNYFKHIVCL